MPGGQPSPTVLAPLPLAFIETAKIVLLHTDPSRHWLLHRMAQRLYANAATWLDTLHPEHVALMHWHRQVRRDMHKMKAFVRFTRVGDGPSNLPEARLIAPLLRQASQRTHAMVSHQDVTRDHRSGVCAPSPVDASAPDALQRLMHRASTCDACDFACHATQMVWGEGRAGAPLMIVGEPTAT